MKASLEEMRATIVLVSRLDEKHATAIVERRPQGSPRDLILIGENAATPEVLRPAFKVLVGLRRDKRQQAAAGARIVIRGASRTERWDPDLRDQAKRDLDRLKAQPKVSIAGVGMGRRIDVFVAK